MSESKFTKGPWQLMQSNPERDGADCWTLLAQPHPGLRGFTRELAILAGPIGDENARANAQLIAAAPDLLEALKGTLPHFEALEEDVFNDLGAMAQESHDGSAKPNELQRRFLDQVAAIRAAILKAESSQ